MAGTPMPYVKIQFMTDAGVPASGYKLFAYDAGGAVKHDTWTDAGLTVANTNPIVLDAAGRANIFLEAQSYKFVLAIPATADPPVGGDVVWSVDDISSAPFFNVSDTVVYTGKVSRWVESGNTLTLYVPPSPVVASNFYYEAAGMTTDIDILAGTLEDALGGDCLILEWDIDYSGAPQTLVARATVFGTNVDLGCGANSNHTRARYVIHAIDAVSVSVSATVIQDTGAGAAQVAMSHTTIASLDLDNVDYTVAMGMTAGTYVIRGARCLYLKGLTSGVL